LIDDFRLRAFWNSRIFSSLNPYILKFSNSEVQVIDYCREIETYLCQKNDGHLIRVVGPSFDMVSRWADDGVPLKVAFRGIDRYFERYYRKGPRRRPVRIDFCEADVLAVFDEWRRATGLALSSDAVERDRRPSLPAHLERVLIKLSSARASGSLGPDADDLVDRVSRELEAARAATSGVRGEARQALLAKLEALDAELLGRARASLDEEERRAVEHDADDELSAFRDRMPEDAYRRAKGAIVDRLVRERRGLPVISF
jgi:hypothetical protein